MARKATRKKADGERFQQTKVYLPATIYSQLRQMAAVESETYSHIAAQILMCFFRGIPKGYGDPIQEDLKAYHVLTMTRPKMPPVPESERLSRVKIGETRGFSTPAGLSSRPAPEDNGPSLTDLQKGKASRRS